jgi:hypothetical protein
MKRLLLALAAPLLALGVAVALSPTLAPTRVEAAGCSLAFNLFDADATNGSNSNPGGTSTSLALPGYTNGELVGVDIRSTSGTACADVMKAGGWYTMLSRWVGAIFGKKLDWSAAPSSEADNWAQVDQVPKSLLNSAPAFDYKNDVGAGASGNPAAAFDLSAAGTATLTSGSTVSVYGDITSCANSQPSTKGFAPDYARRKGGNLGVWYWLDNSATNSNSVALPAGGGSEMASTGGGASNCTAMVPTHSSDTILFDDTTPAISAFTTTAGGAGTKSLVVDLNTSKVSDAGSGAWLMAFSNAPGCVSGSGSWSTWEAYATTKKGWNLASATYGGSGGSSEGLYPACLRVIDKAGNIEIEATSFAYDKTAPTVTGFSSAISSTYGISSYDYTLTFGEAVSGLTSADFSSAGTATGCAFTPSASSGTTFTITVTGCSATGTLLPRLTAGSVTDAGGNASPAAAVTATTTLTLGQKSPVATLTLATAADSGLSSSDGITNAKTLTYPLTFDETATGLAAADFTKSGTATGCVVGTPAGSGASYTITVTGCSEGTLTLTLVAGAVSDTDKLTNAATSATTITIDRTAPVLVSICAAMVEGKFSSCPNRASNAETVEIGFVAVDGIGGSGLASDTLPAQASLAACTPVSLNDSTVLPALGLGLASLCTAEGSYPLSATVADKAGNSGTLNATYVIDRTAPQITIICSTKRYGTYTSCPTGTVSATRFVKVIATDAGSGFAAKSFAVTSRKTCVRIKAGFEAGNKQWTIYRCSARRLFTFESSISDRAGNGPVTLTASWRKR